MGKNRDKDQCRWPANNARKAGLWPTFISISGTSIQEASITFTLVRRVAPSPQIMHNVHPSWSSLILSCVLPTTPPSPRHSSLREHPCQDPCEHPSHTPTCPMFHTYVSNRALSYVSQDVSRVSYYTATKTYHHCFLGKNPIYHVSQSYHFLEIHSRPTIWNATILHIEAIHAKPSCAPVFRSCDLSCSRSQQSRSRSLSTRSTASRVTVHCDCTFKKFRKNFDVGVCRLNEVKLSQGINNVKYGQRVNEATNVTKKSKEKAWNKATKKQISSKTFEPGADIGKLEIRIYHHYHLTKSEPQTSNSRLTTASRLNL